MSQQQVDCFFRSSMYSTSSTVKTIDDNRRWGCGWRSCSCPQLCTERHKLFGAQYSETGTMFLMEARTGSIHSNCVRRVEWMETRNNFKNINPGQNLCRRETSSKCVPKPNGDAFYALWRHPNTTEYTSGPEGLAISTAGYLLVNTAVCRAALPNKLQIHPYSTKSEGFIQISDVTSLRYVVVIYNVLLTPL